MSRLTLTPLTLLVCLLTVAECDAHKKFGHVKRVVSSYAPVSTMSVAPMSFATTHVAPMSVAPMHVAPMTVAPMSVTATHVAPMSVSPVHVAPMSVTSTVPTATLHYVTSPASVSAPQDFSAQSSDSGATPQFINIGGNLIRSFGCSACRSMGCCNSDGGGGSSTDPLKNLSDSLEGLKTLLRNVKTLRESLKDILAEAETTTESSNVARTVSDDPQLVELRNLRTEFRRFASTQRNNAGTRFAKQPE